MIYEFDLNMESGGIPPRVSLSQYDNEEPTLSISLYDHGQPYSVGAGSVVYISGTKKDGKGFEYQCSFGGNVVTAAVTEQMTVFSGDVMAELTIIKDGKRKGSQNFILAVERAALADDVEVSETDIPIIQKLPEMTAEAVEASESAKESAESASESASMATVSAKSANDAATSANSSKAAAASSEANAKNSETNAKTSEANAKTSEANAKTSETNSAKSAEDAQYWAEQAGEKSDWMFIKDGMIYVKYLRKE